MCKRRMRPGGDSTLSPFEQLSRLTTDDPEHFVRLRRAYIAALIDDSGPACAQLKALQQEIDQQRALALAPQQSIDAVMALLGERVARLEALTRELAQQQPSRCAGS